MQNNCNHTKSHCFLNTQRLQMFLDTGTQLKFINKKHKREHLTYSGLAKWNYII